MSAAVLTPPTPSAVLPAMSQPIVSTPPLPLPHPTGLPLQGLMAGFHRFSVDDVEKMINAQILMEGCKLELIDGLLVKKMPQKDDHIFSLTILITIFARMLPAAWHDRCQVPFRVGLSEPEPDHAIVRGGPRDFATRKATPADLGIILEVSDTSLAYDRGDKLRIYARGGVPEYWIVNLTDRQIEVYTGPQPTAEVPTYTTRTDYPAGTAVPLMLDGVAMGTIDVVAVLP